MLDDYQVYEVFSEQIGTEFSVPQNKLFKRIRQDIGHELLYAVRLGKIRNVELLLKDKEMKYGAQNTRDRKGCTALWRASDKGDIEIFDMLTALPDTDIFLASDMGNSPLYQASYKGHLDIVTRLLNRADLEPDKDVNAPNGHGYVPLFAAAQQNHVAICQLLVDRFPTQTKYRAKDGKTALSFARSAKVKELIQNVLDKYAAANDRAKRIRLARENLPAKYLVDRSTDAIFTLLEGRASSFKGDLDCCVLDEDGNTPLAIALHKGDESYVRNVLEFESEETDEFDVVNRSNVYGHTALHILAQLPCASCGEPLPGWITDTIIEKTTDINSGDVDGFTPLHLAAASNNIGLVSSLLGATTIDLHSRCRYRRRTPLHIAAASNSADVVKMLLTAGANAKLFDKDGCQPSALASNPRVAATFTAYKQAVRMQAAGVGGIVDLNSTLELLLADMDKDSGVYNDSDSEGHSIDSDQLRDAGRMQPSVAPSPAETLVRLRRSTTVVALRGVRPKHFLHHQQPQSAAVNRAADDEQQQQQQQEGEELRVSSAVRPVSCSWPRAGSVSPPHHRGVVASALSPSPAVAAPLSAEDMEVLKRLATPTTVTKQLARSKFVRPQSAISMGSKPLGGSSSPLLAKIRPISAAHTLLRTTSTAVLGMRRQWMRKGQRVHIDDQGNTVLSNTPPLVGWK